MNGIAVIHGSKMTQGLDSTLLFAERSYHCGEIDVGLSKLYDVGALPKASLIPAISLTSTVRLLQGGANSKNPSGNGVKRAVLNRQEIGYVSVHECSLLRVSYIIIR